MSDQPHTTRIALSCGVYIALVAACAAAFVSATRMEVTAGPALAMGALPAVLGGYAARAFGPRGRVYVALVPLVLVPLFVLATLLAAMEMNLLRDRVDASTSGSLWLAVALLALPLGIPLFWVMWRLVGRHRALRIGSSTAIVVGTVVTAVAVFARLTRPDPDRWRERLPVVARVSASDWIELDPPVYRARLFRATTSHGQLYRREYFGEVRFAFAAPGKSARTIDDWKWDPSSREFAIRHDDSHGLYILEPKSGSGAIGFVEAGDQVARIEIARVGDAIAPPLLWTIVAALGVAIAAVMRVHAKLRARQDWSEGRVGDDNVVVFGGTRVRADEFEPGTQVVALAVSRATATFRDDAPGDAAQLVSGTLDDRRTEETAVATWALSLVALTVAPIAVFGLLCLVGKLLFN